MTASTVPSAELVRLALVQGTGVLDTASEPSFDDIATLAAEICEVPMALVTLVDADRVWFKSKVGLTETEFPRCQSFCTRVVDEGDMLEIPSARIDPRYAGRELAVSGGEMVFYAGVPVRLTDDGPVVGTLCVIDTRPRTLTEGQRRALRVLARHAGTELELRRNATRALALLDRQDHLAEFTDRVLTTVNHELRTPLSAICGYLELMLDDEDDLPLATRLKFLKVMQRGAQRLRNLVDDMLLMGQLGLEPVALNLAEVDLAAVAGDAVAGHAAQAAEKGVSLRLVAPGPALVNGNRRALDQVLSHLLRNALTYTGTGEVLVEVVAEPRPTVRIRDTGIGVPAAELPHLFERFYRGRNADAVGSQGAGLGLPIVKAIVESHQGSVHLDSEVGIGTRVVLRLPVATSVAAA